MVLGSDLGRQRRLLGRIVAIDLKDFESGVFRGERAGEAAPGDRAAPAL